MPRAPRSAIRGPTVNLFFAPPLWRGLMGRIVKPRPDKVLLTRRRWDAYMAPLFIAVAVIGIGLFWQTGELHFALRPVGVILLWVILRLLTPREGMPVATISETPGATVMLSHFGVALASLALLVAIDVFVFHHPFGGLLELYHVALFAPVAIIAFVGIHRAQRIANAQMLTVNRPQDEA
ncbi:MAG TPA: hypothetical protein VHC22_23410 [Pirellulales bacterium]|nr:hypothetical protein [Pirellulales bacterium]